MNKILKERIYQSLDILSFEINEYLDIIDAIDNDDKLKDLYTIVLEQLINTQKELLAIVCHAENPKKQNVDMDKELEKYLSDTPKTETDNEFPSKQPPRDNFNVREITII